MYTLPQAVSVPKDTKLQTLLNGILAALRAVRPRSSASVRVKESAAGTTYEIIEQAGSAGGLKYKKDYDPSKAYHKDDVVRVRGGSAQGVFVCVKDNPVDLNTGTSLAPEYPEPANQSPPRDNVWEILSLGVVQQTSCVGGGNKNIYINASQPF